MSQTGSRGDSRFRFANTGGPEIELDLQRWIRLNCHRMIITLKRVYEAPAAADGYRVLVDRLWPRGMTKEKATLDEWAKDIAPSHELRKWFHADRTKWREFKKAYLAELAEHRELARQLLVNAGRKRLTLLFASNDAEQNHALVLAEYLKKL